MSTSLLLPESKIGRVLLNMKVQMDSSELSDPARFILENAKCFLCDSSFGEGEETFLIFEHRLRDNGEIDSPLASVLAAALGKELDESTTHSALLCADCNKDLLEFEELMQRYYEMRYRIISSYNRTAELHNLEPITIATEGMLQEWNSLEPVKSPEMVDLKDDKDFMALMEEEDAVQESVEQPEELIDECTNLSSNTDELLMTENDPSKYEFAVIEESSIADYTQKTTTDSDELNVASLQIDGQDIIIYGDVEQDSQLAYTDLQDAESSQSIQDINTNSNDASTILFAIEDSNSSTTLATEDEHQTQALFQQDGSLFSCLQCSDDPQQHWNANSFTDHMKNVHNLSFYTCGQCHAGFLTRQNLKQHVDTYHKRVATGQFNCDICQRTFASSRHLRAHNRIHYGTAKQYECTVCHKKLGCTALLLDHMNLHTGKRPYKCSKCPKDFASKYTLQAHMKIHSERQRRFKCEICEKAFLNQQTLTNHRKLHTNEKSFVCDICSKAFTTQHNLDVHRIVHTGERPFVCRICCKSFARRGEIKDHERVHTGEKPYKCDICEAAFAQRSNLISHRKSIHLNEKMHKCDQCDRAFKRRRLLQYHINAVHTGERPHKCDTCNATFVYPEHLKKHKLIHLPKKQFACEVCGKEFNSRDNRNAHRFVHSDKKPYECVECGAGYTRKPLLLAHMNHAQHCSDTIIVNQAQINKNGTLSLISEVNALGNREQSDDAEQILSSDAGVTTIGTDEESLRDMLPDVDELDKQVEGEDQYFGEVDKEGQEILTWMD